MALIGAWEIESMAKLIGDNFEWDVVKLPVNSEYGRWRSINMCDGMAISSQSTKKEAAWEFVKWCSTNLEAQKMSTVLGVPALTAYADSQEYIDSYPDEVQHYDKSAFFASPDESQPWYNTGKLAEINDLLSHYYELYINDEITLDELVANLNEDGTAVFERAD